MAASWYDKIRRVFQRSSDTIDARPVLSESLQNQNPNNVTMMPVRSDINTRPPLEAFYPFALAGLVGFAAADLTLLYFRDRLIPTRVPPAKVLAEKPYIAKLRNQYNVVTERNIFNSDGIIPPPLSQPEGGDQPEEMGPAVPTSLPLVLVGTIVHLNPAKSVATIEIKSGQSKILPLIPNDDIENFGTLLRVERKRAIFRNNQNGRNEYIEIKDQNTLTFGLKKEITESPVNQSAPGEFSFSRTEVNNYIKNLPELLQQARVEPKFNSGKVDGFCFVDIQPNSVYEKLGLKVGDCLKSVNGEQLDSPAKGLELYQQLRNSNQISLEVDRNGSRETFSYQIR